MIVASHNIVIFCAEELQFYKQMWYQLFVSILCALAYCIFMKHDNRWTKYECCRETEQFSFDLRGKPIAKVMENKFWYLCVGGSLEILPDISCIGVIKGAD